MIKKWVFSIITVLTVMVLSACGKSLDEQIELGVANSQAVFEEAPQEPNHTVGAIEVFLPAGYTIEESEDKANYLLKKDNQEYILFVNSNEQKNSELLYELFKQNSGKQIIKEQTVKTDNEFGFTAIVLNDDDTYELIVNSGNVKISTLSNDHNIDQKLVDMTKIARSVSL
nr:hypothetical protein [Lysinibacillus timonensis]